ncbi:MAG TPA: CehA/McbA family metallohydrolase [Myxococcota bacterium]
MNRASAPLLAAALAALSSAAYADLGVLVAERIREERFDALAAGGPDADAGVGDYALSNGTLCAAIAAPDHETFLSPVGGTLIDLGHCGRADDQWSSLHALPSFDRERVLPISRVEVEIANGEARAVSEGEADGLRVRVTHVLSRAHPSTLRVTTELTRLPGGRRVLGLAELAMHASAQMRSFHLVRRDLARSHGFAHPGGDSLWSALDMLAPEDVHVLVGAEGLPEISYALELRSARARGADGATRTLPAFSVTAEDFTLSAFLPRDFWLGSGEIGLTELMQAPLMSLGEGETLVVERAIHVGARSDVASAADALFADSAPVSGRVDDPRARIHFATASGAPISEVRPAADGSFTLRLPPGSYRATARAPGGRSAAREFALSERGAELALLAVGAPATLTLPQGKTMRLVMLGVGETKTPHFDDDLLRFRVGDGKLRKGDSDNVISLASAQTDPRELALAPGRYRVLATRGLEYGVTEAELTLRAGETRALEIAEPRRAFESPGWIGADLHVHSAESMDAALPLPLQLAAFAAHGGEVVVTTEHDRVIDARPVIARLGLTGRIVSVMGVEVTGTFHGGETPFTIGHLNAFPLRYARTAYRGGAPRSEGVRVRGVIGELRAAGGEPFVQINHPRESGPDDVGDGSFFSHLGVAGKPLDPGAPLDSPRNASLLERGPMGLRDVDFSAVEILNGKRLDRYRLARADWLSLLLQGERRTATANSDSHSRGETVAVPRNYIALANDEVAALDERELLASLRAGRSFGTTGPLVFARLGEAGPGATFAGAEGELSVEVRAAPWVPVRELRVYVNAVLAAKRPIAAGARATLPLRFAGDSFVFVEVDGPADGIYASVLPDGKPFAFTNPIFVDADRDGAWKAPGLPKPAPPLLAEPLEN